MEAQQKRRTRRTPQQLVEALEVESTMLAQSMEELERKKVEMVSLYDTKISKIRDKIKTIEKKKKSLMEPPKARKPRKTKKEKIQAIMKQAQKVGMQPEEIAQRLGIEMKS